MKRLLLLIPIFLVSAAFEPLPDKLPEKMEIARMNLGILGSGVTPPTGDEEESCSGTCFATSWSGSDLLNTGKTYVWDSQSSSGLLSHGTTANNGFNSDQSYYLLSTGQAGTPNYLNEAYAQGTFSARLAYYLDSSSMNEVNGTFFSIGNQTLGYVSIALKIVEAGVNHYLRCVITDTVPGTQNVGSDIQIALDTWYQIRLKFQKGIEGNDAGAGAAWEVQDSGGHISGSPQYLTTGITTKNQDSTYIRIGALTNWINYIARYDGVVVHNSYTYPDLLGW